MGADQDRTVEDWNVQLATSRTDVVQTGYQVAAAEQQMTIACDLQQPTDVERYLGRFTAQYREADAISK